LFGPRSDLSMLGKFISKFWVKEFEVENTFVIVIFPRFEFETELNFREAKGC
jgi:hypothetical protein